MKLIIAGSRDYNDYDSLESEVLKFIKDHKKLDDQNIEIICGMARGADLLGKRFADKHQFPVWEYYANWDEYGKSAGYRRNEDMAKAASHCIVFRIGGEASKGSTHMINLAKKYELVLRVIDL
jgi:hypothetical protein